VMMIFRPQGLLPSRRRSRELRLSELGIGGADGTGPIPGSTQ
jgi:branched-chain amino acid transport system permease protein